MQAEDYTPAMLYKPLEMVNGPSTCNNFPFVNCKNAKNRAKINYLKCVKETSSVTITM